MKKELIGLLTTLADIYEFKGENRFKISAFRNGANIFRRLDKNIAELIDTGEISNIKGIGKGIQSVIEDYYYNSDSTELKRAQEGIPEGIFDILRIRGLGIKKVKLLYDEMSISSIQELEGACKSGALTKLKGFGDKIQNTIIDEIEKLREAEKYLLLNHAEKTASEHMQLFSTFSSVLKCETTGQLRRGMEKINKIELILLINNYDQFLVELANYFDYNELSNKMLSDKFKIIEIKSKIKLRLYLVDTEKHYHGALFLTTGSRHFLEKFNVEQRSMSSENEAEIFEKLGIPNIIPEMREELYFSAPEYLQKNSDLHQAQFNGLLHFHTTKSDGLNTLEEMVNAAEAAGYNYVAVCDHSKSAFYANGLNEKRILLQKKEIEELTKSSSCQIFHGIESDILKDGNLDYDEEYLKLFDFIVASIHSNFGMSEEDMTSRIITAIENPFTDLLGHPTGRILLRRDGYNVNIKKVIDACSRNDVAIELNANPHRLDLDWRNIYYTREKGCKLAINPDAHSISDIEYTKYGIKLARKAGLQTEEVINCFNTADFINYINRKTTKYFN